MKALIGFTLICCLSISFIGCDGLSGEVNELKRQNAELANQVLSLKQEIDDLKNGPSALLLESKNFVLQKNKSAAMKSLDELIEKYPSSAEYAEAVKLRSEIIRLIAEEKKAAEIAKKLEEDKKKKERDIAVKSLEKKYDKVRGLTFYRVAGKDALSTNLEAYIGVSDGGALWLRQSLYYFADDWLFVNGYIIMVDGKKFNFDDVEFERDNSSGSIWEWEDKLANAEIIALLELISASKETIIRFNGSQYYADHTVTSGEKQRLKRVLAAYKSMSSSTLKNDNYLINN